MTENLLSEEVCSECGGRGYDIFDGLHYDCPACDATGVSQPPSRFTWSFSLGKRVPINKRMGEPS